MRLVTEGKEMAKDGVGVTIGIFAAGATGHFIEGYLAPNVTAASGMVDKVYAWAANNVPKLLAYAYGPKPPGGAWTRHVYTGFAASAGIDTGIRLLSGGVNNVSLSVGGVQILGLDAPERAARQKYFGSMPTGFETGIAPESYTVPREAAKKTYSGMAESAVPDRYQLQQKFNAMDGNGQNQLEKMFNCL